MTTVEVTQVKCACTDCVCVVPADQGVDRAGKVYCSEVCADGHKDAAAGCGHKGCSCNG